MTLQNIDLVLVAKMQEYIVATAVAGMSNMTKLTTLQMSK